MNSFEDYDLSFLGEPVRFAAKAKRGFHSGIIALTESRFLYIRKKKQSEYIELEISRDAVASVALWVNIGRRSLSIEHDGMRSTFLGHRRELEPFVEPLRQGATANQPNRGVEKGVYADHDTKIVAEPILIAAKAAGGWRGGVLVLTENRLVYLRKNKDGTFIDRDTNRSAISEFATKPIGGKASLQFKDRDRSVTYTDIGDELDPFIKPLQASAKANESKREVENHVRPEAEVHNFPSTSTGSATQAKPKPQREPKHRKQESKTTRISKQYERGKRLEAIGGGGCAISIIVILIIAFFIPGLNIVAAIATVVGIIALLVNRFGKSERDEAAKDATVASLLNSDDES